MKYISLFALLLLYSVAIFAQNSNNEYVLVIHGGAGNIKKANMPDSVEKKYIDNLNAALAIGEKILKNGGTAVEAVEKTINYLEDCPLFNAGKGAVFTADGTIEIDASIMDGTNLMAGAIAGVTDIKNPISCARRVMEKSNHVFLSGKGASLFAKEQGLEMVENSYFFTPERLKQLQREQQKKNTNDLDVKGTVGCVALDKYGNLAAGTSTGGMSNKKWGRIGDSPVIGAGTYANNETCAVSCTGHGEFFIRYTVAHDVSALMAYKKMPLKKAAELVVMQKLVKAGGSGGLIAVDRKGNVAMPFNSDGMFRGFVKSSGEKEIKIFK